MKICYELNETEQVAKELIKSVKSKTLLFYGDMGVGKTTLISALVKALGSHDDVNSPTFSIVNEYELKNDKIYHFDLYRIKDLDEAYNFGIEDYLDSGHWIFIEWPEKIENLLDDSFDMLKLNLGENNSRILIINN